MNEPKTDKNQNINFTITRFDKLLEKLFVVNLQSPF